jgi:hypothetical protein
MASNYNRLRGYGIYYILVIYSHYIKGEQLHYIKSEQFHHTYFRHFPGWGIARQYALQMIKEDKTIDYIDIRKVQQFLRIGK